MCLRLRWFLLDFVSASGWFGVYCLIASVCGLGWLWRGECSWVDCGGGALVLVVCRWGLWLVRCWSGC